MLEGDLWSLRCEWLFMFAHWCHMPPREVDGLGVNDFCGLVRVLERVADDLERAQRS